MAGLKLNNPNNELNEDKIKGYQTAQKAVDKKENIISFKALEDGIKADQERLAGLKDTIHSYQDGAKPPRASEEELRCAIDMLSENATEVEASLNNKLVLKEQFENYIKENGDNEFLDKETLFKDFMSTNS